MEYESTRDYIERVRREAEENAAARSSNVTLPPAEEYDDYDETPKRHRIRNTLGFLTVAGIVFVGGDNAFNYGNLTTDKLFKIIDLHKANSSQSDSGRKANLDNNAIGGNAAPSDAPSIDPSSPKLPPTMQECIAEMPVRYKLAQNMFVPVTFDGKYYTNDKTSVNETFALLDKYDIGNVIVMGDPNKDPNKTIKQFSDPQVFEDPLIVASDQEGGIVRRLSNNMPSQQEVGKKYTPEQAEKFIKQYYESTKKAGITMVFGPVLDVSRQDGKPSAIGQERIFPGEPLDVGNLAKSYIKAAQAAGLSPVGKHFPGGGSMTKNTDESDGVAFLPDEKTLRERDLNAWEVVADDLDHAMLSTAAVTPSDSKRPNTSWTKNKPAVFSDEIYKALEDYGVDGMIVTDDLGTHAITDANGEPQILPQSFVEVWKRGGTPLFVKDVANADINKVLSFDRRLKTILDAGQKAVSEGLIEEKVLNHTMEVHLAIQERSNEACDILERLDKGDDEIAEPLALNPPSSSPSPTPTPTAKPSVTPSPSPKASTSPSAKPTTSS